jgi:hypothetical protein
MAKIRIVGDSSGYVEIAAPNAAGNNTLELPSGNTRLVGSDSAGNVSISGIVTASSGFVGNITGNINAPGVSTIATLNVTQSNPTRLNVTGVSTFTSGPVLVGSGTSTGTASQRLQVDGNAYVSGQFGIGQTNPVSGSYLDIVAGSGSAPTFKGYVRIGPNNAQSLSSNGGLEFLSTTFSNGYGWRAHSPDLGGGSVPFVVESRADSSTWTERLRIDQSGRVTRPYQPAFNASGSPANVSYSGGNIFQFNTADLNVGSHFNTSTYRFTAPVAGVYLFGVSIYVNGNLSGCFTVNGTQTYGGSDVQPLVYGDLTRSYSAQLLVSLSANDIVDFRSRDSTASSSIYMGHSNFWGYLM